MRSLFILVAAGCISTAHAGDLRPDPPIFAAEVIQPNGPTDLIMPASQLAYVLGVGLDQRPFRLRFDFAPARLNSPIAAGRLGLEINSPFGADARLIADVGEGGRPGDDFVEFSFRVEGIVSADDALTFDMEGVAMRLGGAELLGEAPIEIQATLRDNNGVIDANGRRTGLLLAARPCVSADFTPGGRGLASVPRETFVGLPRTVDATSWLTLGLADCRRSDGQIVNNIGDLGTMSLRIEGALDGIDRVEVRGLGAFESDGDDLVLDIDLGPIEYAGPISIRVDGRTLIAEQVLDLTVDFQGRVPGTDRRLLGPRPLTRWEPIDRRQIVNVTPLPDGLECPEGGVLIEEGTDDNYSGELDAGEVTNSHILCNGETGAPGQAGYDVLQSVEPAPANDDCVDGGWRISSGRDTNRDGNLQAEEVEALAVICNGVRGEDGAEGQSGPVGRAGERGAPGPLGDRGPQGEQGEAGGQGESACGVAPGSNSGGWLFGAGLLALGLRRRRA